MLVLNDCGGVVVEGKLFGCGWGGRRAVVAVDTELQEEIGSVGGTYDYCSSKFAAILDNYCDFVGAAVGGAVSGGICCNVGATSNNLTLSSVVQSSKRSKLLAGQVVLDLGATIVGNLSRGEGIDTRVCHSRGGGGGFV